MKVLNFVLTSAVVLGFPLLHADVCAQSRASDEIRKKFEQLGGENGFLGKLAINESDVPGLASGRAVEFENGLICWCPGTGAHELHGAILEKWGGMREGRKVLGCPRTDEEPAQSGRHNDFEYGFIYWSEETHAHAVYGEIGKKWAEMGRETSPLGYPTGDEQQDGARRISRFKNGYIYMSNDEGLVVGPKYTFRLEKLVIETTRAMHEDDDAISFSLKIDDKQKPDTRVTFLHGVNNGEHAIGLEIGPIFIPYNHPPIAFNYVIRNEGDNDEWEELVRENAGMLFRALTEDYKKSNPDDQESADRADVASDTEYAKADGGLMLGAMVMWSIFSESTRGGACNGLVAADQVTVGGNALAKWTDETGEHRQEKFHNARNIPSMCLGSAYRVTWSIVRQ